MTKAEGKEIEERFKKACEQLAKEFQRFTKAFNQLKQKS